MDTPFIRKEIEADITEKLLEKLPKEVRLVKGPVGLVPVELQHLEIIVHDMIDRASTRIHVKVPQAGFPVKGVTFGIEIAKLLGEIGSKDIDFVVSSFLKVLEGYPDSEMGRILYSEENRKYE